MSEINKKPVRILVKIRQTNGCGRLDFSNRATYNENTVVQMQGVSVMKESYEPIEMEIREIPEEDVITASGIEAFSEHDNAYIDWTSFF